MKDKPILILFHANTEGNKINWKAGVKIDDRRYECLTFLYHPRKCTFQISLKFPFQIDSANFWKIYGNDDGNFNSVDNWQAELKIQALKVYQEIASEWLKRSNQTCS